MTQYYVAALKKDRTIFCVLLRVLGHLGSSETVNINLLDR